MENSKTPFRSGNTESNISQPNQTGAEEKKANTNNHESNVSQEPDQRHLSNKDDSSEPGKKFQQASLVGQGGYGTTDPGSESYTYKPEYKEVDINKLGKNVH